MTHRPDGDEPDSGGRPAEAPPLSPPVVGGERLHAEDLEEEFERQEHQDREDLVIGSTQPAEISTTEGSPPVFGAGDAGGGGKRRAGDRVFAGLTSGAGAFIVLLVLLIGVFLIWQAVPAIKNDKSNFITSRDWSVNGPELHFGILGLLWATVLISAIAMLLAIPISLGIALFTTQYAPKRLARPVAYIIDLLAAIPSIIYGIWGITILAPKLEHIQRALYHLGGFPLFKDEGVLRGSIFDGGVVLAIMILPITTAISRDVFERTPRANIEAAWALGATRWEMIRMSVLPYGRAGVVSGAMLGLGRALGETIAILLIVSAPSQGAPFTPSIFAGGQTFASKIAGDSAEFANTPGPYIAAGLVLFVLTFLVNAAARSIVNRKKEFS
jgi:phosphate transport system permease protein